MKSSKTHIHNEIREDGNDEYIRKSKCGSKGKGEGRMSKKIPD